MAITNDNDRKSTTKSYMSNYADKIGRKTKEFSDKEYTPESLVIDLLKLIPFDKHYFVLDAGSGFNKVWYNNIHTLRKDEVEIEEGKDFLKYDKRVDWVIGNPPYKMVVEFVSKASEISDKGFAFLINQNRLMHFTPVRLKKLEDKGFTLNAIQIVSIKKWFGRYYFLIFSKEKVQRIGYSCISYQ